MIEKDDVSPGFLSLKLDDRKGWRCSDWWAWRFSSYTSFKFDDWREWRFSSFLSFTGWLFIIAPPGLQKCAWRSSEKRVAVHRVEVPALFAGSTSYTTLVEISCIFFSANMRLKCWLDLTPLFKYSRYWQIWLSDTPSLCGRAQLVVNLQTQLVEISSFENFAKAR